MRFIAAYTVNQLGTWFGVVALSVVVYDHTHDALAVASLFAAAQAIPALLVAPLVTRLEASPSRFALSSLYFCETVITVVLIAFVRNFSLAGILVLAGADGLAALSARALLRAAASRQSISEHLAAASVEADAVIESDGARQVNAAMNLGLTTTVVIGPALAGLAVSGLGGSAALLIDAASFLAAGTLLIGTPAAAADDGSSVRARLAEAWRSVRSAVALRALLIGEGVALIAFQSAVPIEVLYAKGSLHAGDAGYGLLIGCWGAGQVFGSVIFMRWRRRPVAPLLVGGTLVVAAADLGFAAAPDLLLACVAAVIGGLGNSIQWPSFISAAQDLSPREMHGRLMGTIETLGAVCPAIAFPLGGIVAAASSPRAAMAVAGGMAAVVGVALMRVLLTARRPVAAAEVA